jgi:glycosyltransferase involved in cell wall biosynthesis
MRRRVSFVTLVRAHYRKRFHELVRDLLASRGIDYELIYSDLISETFSKKIDESDLSWAKKVKVYSINIGSRRVYWQSAVGAVMGSDLVIVGQENRLLFNYWAHLTRCFGNHLAYFGHGRNFNEQTETFEAKFKEFLAKRVDWWFAYTEKTRQILTGYGFPADRITVINNAIDTSEIRRVSSEIDESQLATLRANLGISTNRVGVYVGRLYNIKRVDFLIDAAIEIRRQVPDFKLIVVGGGSDSDRMKIAAVANPWIIYLGARYGREKVEILRLGRVFMMPGAVGLSILDCAAAGIPMVTTAYPSHGPEIDYLEPGRTGIIVNDWQNPKAYADAVVSILCDDALYKRLAIGAWDVGTHYTIEKMAQCFADGVVDAITVLKNAGRRAE